MATLIFPSTVPEAQEEARRHRAAGERIIGAASLAPNHPAGTFDDWFRLPTLYDAHFLDALRSLVTSTGVETVVAPAADVHDALSAWARDGRLPCPLKDSGPIRSAMGEWSAHAERAEQVAGWLRAAVGIEADRTLINAAMSMPGMVHGESNEDKMVGLCAAGLTAPAGELVEIGVQMGRSSALLALMARERGNGLVTVDPWSVRTAFGSDTVGAIDEVATDVISDAFFAHMTRVTRGPFAHLRYPSVEATQYYRAGANLHTPGFDPVQATGRVALLHINGHPGLEAVRADWSAWRPFLAVGAWVIFEGYASPDDDGPRCVADRAFADHALDGAFVAGNALFFRWRG